MTALEANDYCDDDDSTRPVLKQLLEWLIAENEFAEFPYNPHDHGYIALVESGDVQRELDDIDMPRLTDIMWEGVSTINGFYHAVYLGAGDYGIGFVVPVDARWLSDKLRKVLDSLLDDQSFRPTNP